MAEDDKPRWERELERSAARCRRANERTAREAERREAGERDDDDAKLFQLWLWRMGRADYPTFERGEDDADYYAD